MAKTSARTAPFAPFEWMIAWRYLRARRAEGGVSVMTWISFIGMLRARTRVSAYRNASSSLRWFWAARRSSSRVAPRSTLLRLPVGATVRYT